MLWWLMMSESDAAEVILREAEFRRCVSDEVYFLEEFVKIRIPGRGRSPLVLRDAQKQTLELWNSERYTVALKARQIGFSTLAAAHALWLAMFRPDTVIVMISKGEREAAKLLKKSSYGYQSLPGWLKERASECRVDNVTKMEFGHESVIESLPSGEDPGRGEAVDLAIVDEWAFLPNPEDAWASIEPITDVGGRVIGISTANGSGNFFHNHYVAAKTKNSSFRSIFFPWDSIPERDADWYQVKAANMPAAQLHQEYPRDDEECFIKSGNPVFDMDAFEGLVAEPGEQGVLTKRLGEVGFTEASNGEYTVWEPPSRDGVYAVGADVAEGLEHGDWSVAHVVDARSQRVVAKYRAHCDPDIFGKQVLWLLGQWYNNALIGVEANNHGLTTATALRDTGYNRIYYRHKYDERFGAVEKKIGWYTSAKSKPVLIDELRQACRDGFVCGDHTTIEEMRTYARTPNGRMSGSPFDDHVMSFAIAVKMLDHVYAEEFTPSRPLPEMSMGRILQDALSEGDARGRLLTDTSRRISTRL